MRFMVKYTFNGKADHNRIDATSIENAKGLIETAGRLLKQSVVVTGVEQFMDYVRSHKPPAEKPTAKKPTATAPKKETEEDDDRDYHPFIDYEEDGKQYRKFFNGGAYRQLRLCLTCGRYVFSVLKTFERHAIQCEREKKKKEAGVVTPPVTQASDNGNGAVPVPDGKEATG